MPQLITQFTYNLEDLSIVDINESSVQLYLSPVNSLYQIALSRSPTGELDYQLLICNLLFDKEDWVMEALEDFKDECVDEPNTNKLIKYLCDLIGMKVSEFEKEIIGTVGVTSYNDGYLSGVQIRSTYIQEDHRGNKLSEKAYSYLASRFELVLSDIRQTANAATLWQNALSRTAIVSAYDTAEKKVLEIVSPDKNLNGRYWSITPMDKSKKDAYINAKEKYELGTSIDTVDCKIHIILTMENSKLN